VGSAFLGLSIGCARCHDHKFDPILQTDYYQLQAFFTPLQRENVPAEFISAELTGRIVRRKAELDAELKRRRRALQDFRVELKDKLAKAEGKKVEEISDRDLSQAVKKNSKHFTEADRKRYLELRESLDELKDAKRYDAVAVTVKNPDDQEDVPETHVLMIGDVFHPGDKVEPGFLSAVGPLSAELFEEVTSSAKSASGRRRILADWIASPKNPITVRVLVNRIWHYHMGRGLVATPNDFGTNGSGPSHPELLDFLASWFLDQGWRLKPLHRLLVLSHTYRQSISHPQGDACRKVDADNQLLWRSHFRRLESEAVRDAMLAASGSLNHEQGGPGFYETLPDKMSRSIFMFTWKASAEDRRFRRSIYMFQRRNFILPMMEVFDAPDMIESCAQRQPSVTAPQALTLLNSKFAYKTSRLFAERILREAGETPRQQVEFLYQVAYSSPPEQEEMDDCVRFLAERRDSYGQEKPEKEKTETKEQDKQPKQEKEKREPTDPQLAALTDLCLVIFNTNRFLFLE